MTAENAPDILIRTATSQDRAAIAALHLASWRDVYRGMLPDAYLTNEAEGDLRRQWTSATVGAQDLLLVADAGGEIIGFIAIWMKDAPFIDNLHVSPSLRSGGVGRRLLAEAARRLRERGEDSAYLWVFAENTRAAAFYERLGGRVAERADKDVFGQRVPSLRIVWDGLAPLVRADADLV